MNPRLDQLQPYPFQRLKKLLGGSTPPAGLRPIDLSIGEPKHAAPSLVLEALQANAAGLSLYPATLGTAPLRQAIADWLARRYDLPPLDPERAILPVNGSREALFSFVQAVVNPQPGAEPPVVIMPNPFYQIYEGAAILAGATPYYLNCEEAGNCEDTRNCKGTSGEDPNGEGPSAFQPDWVRVPEAIWQRTEVVFVCTPGNPTGAVMTLQDWQQLFALSDRYGFVIASDECYSEIWQDAPPLGGLQAARQLGRDMTRLVVFSSLSKRSNLPGLRSGFVAGDPDILARFLLYRTYHGSAMSPMVQAASAAAWQDEHHVAENRALYRAKFEVVLPLLAPVLPTRLPQAGFYLWARIPARYGDDDPAFAQALFANCKLTVLPGSYLARTAHGSNPGAGRVRIALVPPLEDCLEAAWRMAEFAR